jgi:limonene-1,2-epoxide hydrolase
MSEASAVDVVRSFLEALERQDVDAVLGLSSPEIVYQNVPLPPARGLAAFERQMQGFQKYFTGFEAHVKAIAAADDGVTVLTERIDVLERGRWRAEFWVCGTFEVREGRVALWRDYFDYADVTVAAVKGAGRALAGLVAQRRGR